MQIKSIRNTFYIFIIVISINGNSWAQCCGGGGGSPIAGGSSQGVLQENQFEINTNLQFINTNKYFVNERDTFFPGSFKSQYSYTRLAYGISKKFTISLETGYWLNKTEVDRTNTTYKTSGIGDLIIFPRYNVFNIEKNHKKTELTVGLGFKIPLGNYNDSTGIVEPFSGEKYYVSNPLALQTSSGSHDIIFYTFLSRTYSFYDLRLFVNALYVKKGWNPSGEKMGDYASVGLFAGKTFFKKLGITLQLKGEWIAKMKINEYVLLNDFRRSYEPDATGSKKVFFVPQISYNYKSFVIYALSEIPVYQYLTKIQFASQFQTTVGISYRFMVKKAAAVTPIMTQ